MVRVFLKGGVWKNSEDEILKAAVQKYGKQQWSRVASLLNRKTAKQAKARWHEWLDPSIRKTEWSKVEDEKLLHLARLMPAQWKTIAPMVGRTAVQCQEHYEHLLDQATATAGAADETDGLRQASAASMLRPGQIDSHPETKPAKPDPIDMDEDEMEMLQEARARLANTQGKKAKRKQRDRILESAKRLADLQKRRELKQAGLLSSMARKKSKQRRNEIDLGVEIPFHKPAPAGFHDTAAEAERVERLRQKRLQQIDFGKINESQYRTRDREAAAARKREESRLKILEESNEKYASAATGSKKKQDEEELLPAMFRGSLQLPAPTVTDAELSLQSRNALRQDGAASLGGGGVTQALLGDYSSRPLPTPMRTTADNGSGTDLVRAASQLRQLERGQTPLLAAASLSAVTEEEDEEDDDRKLPAKRSAAGRATPGSVATRDLLGLNTQQRAFDDHHSVGGSTFATDSMSIRDLARQERRAAKRARAELEAALAALPAPQFEYELAAPEPPHHIETVDDGMDVDADQADVEAAEREARRLAAQTLYEARNSVIKRKELPRPPVSATYDKYFDAAVRCLGGNISSEGSSRLITAEMKALLEHDAYAYPFEPDGKKKKTNKKRKAEIIAEVEPATAALKEVQLELLPETALSLAKQIIQDETDAIVDAKVNAVMGDGKASCRDDALEFLARVNARVSAEGAETMVYLPGCGWIEAASEKDLVESLRYEFTTLREATEAMKRKNDKIASKLKVVNGGYVKRADKFQADILQTFAELENSKIEESVYRTLQSHETQGGANRIDRLKEEIKQLRKAEAELQKRYGELVVKKRRLQVAAGAQAQSDQ